MRALAALGLVLSLLLAACASVIDADQARLCRAIPPALHDESASISETDLTPVPGVAGALRLAYVVRGEDGAGPHWIICRFAGNAGPDRMELGAVDADLGPLGDVKLAILKRWWLADLPPDALPVAPLSIPGDLAYWLQQLLNGITLAGVYGLIATSFALIHGLIGRINLAFGEVAVAGGAVTLAVMGVQMAFFPPDLSTLVLSMVSGIAAAAVLSWVVGRCLLLPLTASSRSPQPVLIGTVALAIVLAEFLRITSRMRETWLPPFLNDPLPIAGDQGFTALTTPAQMLAAGLGLSGTSAVLALLAFTRFGRAWRAYADDPLMAAMLGLRVPRLLAATFLLAGACTGLAGTVVVTAYGTIMPGDGLAITLKALVAAVIGGLGSVPGAFAGAILVAAVETLWSATFDIVYRDVVIYSLLVVALVLRPGGLSGRAAPTPREF